MILSILILIIITLSIMMLSKMTMSIMTFRMTINKLGTHQSIFMLNAANNPFMLAQCRGTFTVNS
jgi:hypothetical protein